MSVSRHSGGIIIFATLLIALLLTVFPMPEWARPLRPQWYTLALIYWVMALPQRMGVLSGWLLGLVVDVLTGTLLGQHALSLALIAFLTHQTHLRMRLVPLWQQSLSVLGLLLLEKLFSFWVMGAVAAPTPPLAYWTPPLVGMFLWPWIYIVLRDLRRRFQVS
ncbi:MAG: rod shape-determining protein MreD [gamma proteobacterium symbiont of Phacoides pectinatus]